MNRMVLGCTALRGSNKAGILRPDDKGYYEVVLGALDFQNSYGAVYPQAPAREMFKEGSGFMRRLRAGYCRGEYGHPKMEPGMTDRDYLRRILTIEETRISHHHRDVWIDVERVKHQGRPVISIMGNVKPAGPYGQHLQASLDNPDENVAFSIRSLTDDYMVRGQLKKNLREVVGWDFVVEPGLAPANKYQAPSLESMFQDFTMSRDTIAELAEERNGCVSMEATAILKNLLSSMDRESTPRSFGGLPRSTKW